MVQHVLPLVTLKPKDDATYVTNTPWVKLVKSSGRTPSIKVLLLVELPTSHLLYLLCSFRHMFSCEQMQNTRILMIRLPDQNCADLFNQSGQAKPRDGAADARLVAPALRQPGKVLVQA